MIRFTYILFFLFSISLFAQDIVDIKKVDIDSIDNKDISLPEEGKIIDTLNFETIQQKSDSIPFATFSTKDSITIENKRRIDSLLAEATLTRAEKLVRDPLTPSKASFFSAAIPGLGQYYLRKDAWWKIPAIYVGISVGIIGYMEQNNRAERYRYAFKRRQLGYQDDEFIGIISNPERLLDGMKFYRSERNTWLFVAVGMYALNIIDASVSAHLLSFNVNDNLVIKPTFPRDIHNNDYLALNLNLKF